MDEKEQFDAVVFCGNIKDFPQIVSGVDMSYYAGFIEKLAYHGTTTVLCEIEPNSYSWIYLPDSSYAAHRIICTGNFALSNNANGKTGATIEFTGYLSEQDILEQLAKIPFSPTYITHSYTKYTYPVQNENTRSQVGSLQAALEKENIYLLGRFAEWEYYNMDAAIGAAMDLSEKIIKINQ